MPRVHVRRVPGTGGTVVLASTGVPGEYGFAAKLSDGVDGDWADIFDSLVAQRFTVEEAPAVMAREEVIEWVQDVDPDDPERLERLIADLPSHVVFFRAIADEAARMVSQIDSCVNETNEQRDVGLQADVDAEAAREAARQERRAELARIQDELNRLG